MEINKIYNQDCYDGMDEIDEDSIDLIVTDPPYGIAFMKKDWDKAIPNVRIWKESLRVLKSGGFAFIMCIPRQDCLSHMIQTLKNAGFDTGFTSIYWTFASGFPKAENISKSVDKRLGAEREVVGFDSDKYRPYNTMGGTSEGWERPWMNDDDAKINRALITKPKSEKAKSLDGSYAGFQPKPAVEVILVCMKPLSKETFVEQAMKNKKGIAWLDDCRIPTKESLSGGAYQDRDGTVGTIHCERNVVPKDSFIQPTGRFPANLLVSDDILSDGKKWRSGGSVTGNEPSQPTKDVYGEYERVAWQSHGDSGSFSRYFDLDYWFSERIKQLPKEIQKTFPFMIIPKASESEKNKGLDNIEPKYLDPSRKVGSPGGTNPRNRGAESPKRNFHPTVKPIKLMSYLITLGSRRNDTILDPFIGSGTTAIACKLLRRNYIGFEIDSEFCKIANTRIKSFVTSKSLLGI